MALGALEEADSIRTIAAPSTQGNNHDLQPALRAEAIDTPKRAAANLTALSYMIST